MTPQAHKLPQQRHASARALVRPSSGARPTELDRYMKEIGRYPLLSADQERVLAERLVATKDVAAAHTLVVSNLRFVVKLAYRYKGYGLKMLDLIQEGNIGLMVAVRKFDPSRGFRLITYAAFWIRAAMQSFILRSWSLVRLGSSRLKRQLFFKLKSERQKIEQSLGEPVGDAEMARVMGVKEADVALMQARHQSRDVSLNAPLRPEAGATFQDILADTSPLADRTVEKNQAQQRVQRALGEIMGTLNDKERSIVSNRLLADEPKSLQDIGDAFQITRERVRQLEARVVKKLKAALCAPAGPMCATTA